jgi:hypothetical protein
MDSIITISDKITNNTLKFVGDYSSESEKYEDVQKSLEDSKEEFNTKK